MADRGTDREIDREMDRQVDKEADRKADRKIVLPVFMDFSHTYRREAYEGVWLEASGIPGTNCYCDEGAERELRELLQELSPEGLHYLDSGNYHYMSKLWIEKITEPFDLLVLDHHTDMQQPAFGDILSCGGWIRSALDGNPYLEHIYIAGPPAAAVKETIEEAGDTWIYDRRLTWIPEEAFKDCEQWRRYFVDNGRPVYISVDKDVLDPSWALTNWDQGNVSLPDLLARICETADFRPLIGMDICGEDPEGTGSEEEQAVNEETNRQLGRIYAGIIKTGRSEDTEQ